MAQRVHIEMVDDLDGTTKNVETVPFALDGTTYEIDLSQKNAKDLRKALASYVDAARRTGGKRQPKVVANGKVKVQQHSTREIRDWARSNGFEVSNRGAIPTNVREAFAGAVE